jgi:hypothetical protein
VMAWNAYLRLVNFRNMQRILLQAKFTSVGKRSYINDDCDRSRGLIGLVYEGRFTGWTAWIAI